MRSRSLLDLGIRAFAAVVVADSVEDRRPVRLALISDPR